MAMLNTFITHWRSLIVTFAAVILVLFAARGPEAMPGEDPACSDEIANLQAGEILSERLEILSWNIQKASNQGWQEDLARFGEGVHLAFIQEAALEAPLVETIDSTEYRSFAAGYATNERSTGVMTLSSSAPSISCNYQSVEPWLGTPKATGVTFHEVAGLAEPLLAVNLHAVNFAMGIKEYREQIHLIKDLVTHHEGPIIVASDANAWWMNSCRNTACTRWFSPRIIAPVCSGVSWTMSTYAAWRRNTPRPSRSAPRTTTHCA